MSNLLVIVCYFLFAYGLSWALVYGDGYFNVIEHVRDYFSKLHPSLEKLFSCMFCMPSNVGFVFSLFNILFFQECPLSPFNLIIEDKSLWWLIIPMDSCATGAMVYITNTLVEIWEKTSEKLDSVG